MATCNSQPGLLIALASRLHGSLQCLVDAFVDALQRPLLVQVERLSPNMPGRLWRNVLSRRTLGALVEKAEVKAAPLRLLGDKADAGAHAVLRNAPIQEAAQVA